MQKKKSKKKNKVTKKYEVWSLDSIYGCKNVTIRRFGYVMQQFSLVPYVNSVHKKRGANKMTLLVWREKKNTAKTKRLNNDSFNFSAL